MIFDEEFQLYFSWTMNMQEFVSWVDKKMNDLGAEDFNLKYPTFDGAYKEYINMLKGY